MWCTVIAITLTVPRLCQFSPRIFLTLLRSPYIICRLNLFSCKPFPALIRSLLKASLRITQCTILPDNQPRSQPLIYALYLAQGLSRNSLPYYCANSFSQFTLLILHKVFLTIYFSPLQLQTYQAYQTESESQGACSQKKRS